MKMYNCEKITLLPPKNLISFNYSDGYKDAIDVDKCLSNELLVLWELKIETKGCCCGHGKHLGFIQVSDEHIETMYSLGYQNYIYEDKFGGTNRKDAFIPKSIQHIYDGYSDGFLG